LPRTINPLRLFPGEKTAADPREPPGLPPPPADGEIDPGERALAGLTAGTSALASKLIPIITRPLVQPIYEADSTAWTLPRVRGVSSFDEAARQVVHGAPASKTRMMGLMDISERPRPTFRSAYRKSGAGSIDELAEGIGRAYDLEDQIRQKNIRPGKLKDAQKLVDKMKPIAETTKPLFRLAQVQNTVDSFIDKHRLAEKGVRLNLQTGPFSSIGGGGYDMHTKEVTIPRVGKENVLHELGHAADYSTRVGRIRRIAEPILSRGVGIALPVALAAGDRIKEIFPGTVDDKTIAFMQDNAPQIMGATLAATTLYPEAKASFLAVRHIAETEGRPAAKAALKKLIPYFGTYLLGAVPAVVGMALARKYMRQAREEKAETKDIAARTLADLEKTGGIIGGFKDAWHVGKQIGRGTLDLVTEPGRIRKIVQSAKEIGTSPEFILGAVGSAIPAAAGALYMYGTQAGKAIRAPMLPEGQARLLELERRDIGPVARASDEWRESHPLRFAGLVAMGAALSGGIISKFMSDLSKAL
jgi:hypothetical protein